MSGFAKGSNEVRMKIKMKECIVCGELTELACSDCQIDLRATVYICCKRSCMQSHESKHHGGATVIHSDGSISGEIPLTFRKNLGNGGYGV